MEWSWSLRRDECIAPFNPVSLPTPVASSSYSNMLEQEPVTRFYDTADDTKTGMCGGFSNMF